MALFDWIFGKSGKEGAPRSDEPIPFPDLHQSAVPGQVRLASDFTLSRKRTPEGTIGRIVGLCLDPADARSHA